MINLIELNCTRHAEEDSTALKALLVYFMVELYLTTAPIS